MEAGGAVGIRYAESLGEIRVRRISPVLTFLCRNSVVPFPALPLPGYFSMWRISAPPKFSGRNNRYCDYFFMASEIATATDTEAPTIGLLPMPMRPIISTCAGTEEEPANCASECMRPMVSVMP